MTNEEIFDQWVIFLMEETKKERQEVEDAIALSTEARILICHLFEDN